MPLSKYDIDLTESAGQVTSHTLMVELVGANKRVLDVGCDTGYLGRALMERGNTVAGFEVDPVTAAEAAKYLDPVVVGDLEATDLVEAFGPANFDVVVFGDVLEHLRDPLPVLQQARRLLAAGGSVVISTPNIAHGDIRLNLLRGRFDYTKVGILDNTHTKLFTRESLVRFLDDAGFTLADLRRTRAGLFSTEVGVSESDFDPQVVDRLRSDVEATTYQFVLRAVPDDSSALETVQALRLDQLSSTVDKLRADLEAQRDRVTSAQAQLEQSQAMVDQVKAAHDDAVAQRDHAVAQVSQLSEQLQQLQQQVRALDVRPAGLRTRLAQSPVVTRARRLWRAGPGPGSR